MRRRSVPALGQAVEHVADVAHEHVGLGGHVDPARRAVHLQPAAVVLGEQRQQAVVGVLGDAPVRVVAGWVVEDPEQHRRIGRQVLLEPGRGEPEADRDAAHDGGRDAFELASATPGSPGRGRPARRGTGWARAAERRRRHAGASAGCSAPTYRPSLRSGRPDVSSPPTGNQPRQAEPAFAIAIACLTLVRLGEELACRGVDPAQQVGIDTMPGDAEEPDVAAGPIDLTAATTSTSP